MGIFSTKRKHYVDTQITRVIPDVQIPPPMTNHLVEAIYADRDIVSTLKHHVLHGRYRKFEKFFKYAANGDYHYGLPDSQVLTSNAGFAAAQAAIETEVGEAVTIDYMHYRALNNTHAGWKHITDTLAYNHATNEIEDLSVTKGFPVYLDKMVAVHETAPGQVPEVTSMGTWGYSPASGATPQRHPVAVSLRQYVSTQEVRFSAVDPESVEIHYIWEDAEGDIQTEFITVDLSAIDTAKEFYQAKYRYGSPEVTAYWTYDPDDDTHVALTDVFNFTYTNPGTFFPIVPFRSEDVNQAGPGKEGTPAYDTSVELLSHLDMDFQTIADAMHEDDSIGDVDQAVMMMGIPITSDNPVDIEYLHRFFADLHERLPAEAQTVNYSEIPRLDSRFGLSSAPKESFALDIGDADFRMTISFDRLIKTLKAGSIGTIGTYTNELFTELPVSAFDKLSEVSQAVTNEELAEVSVRIFRKQISTGVYEEIRVVNPKARYHIYKNMGAEGGADDERLLIPLDHTIANEMSILKIGTLYYRSLHFVFNSHVSQKAKWYETGAFKTILTIAAVVITILSFGAGVKTMLAAASVAGTAALAQTIIQIVVTEILKNMVFQFVLEELVSIIGPENAFWLAVAAAAAGGVAVLKKAGPTLKAAGYSVTLTAENLLKASTNLVKAGESVMSQKIADYMSDVRKFDLYQQEKIAELKEIEDLLDTKSAIDPYTFIGQVPLTLLGEAPSSFFYRTVHIDNIGTRIPEIAQNFVSNAVRLPTVQETMRDALNAA